ncbi:hypothetical protein CHUAL_008561 [Chamberlinius hualienensis]
MPTLNVDVLYLKHHLYFCLIYFECFKQHWQIALSKRFRSLKLWFVIRSFGIKGLQEHVRKGVKLAEYFESLVEADELFEFGAKRHLGMVVFRLKGNNELTEKLLKKLNSNGKIHCVPASLKGKYVIRFTVTSAQTTTEDIVRDWNVIRQTAQEILIPATEGTTSRVNMKDIKRLQPEFGSSLLLANSPMSPKIVNGSYIAIFDNHDVLFEFSKKLQGLRIMSDGKHSPAMRRRIKGMIMAGKQYSLDSRMDLVQTIVSTTLPSTTENNNDDDDNDPNDVFVNSSEAPSATAQRNTAANDLPSPLTKTELTLPDIKRKNTAANQATLLTENSNLRMPSKMRTTTAAAVSSFATTKGANAYAADGKTTAATDSKSIQTSPEMRSRSRSADDNQSDYEINHSTQNSNEIEQFHIKNATCIKCNQAV